MAATATLLDPIATFPVSRGAAPPVFRVRRLPARGAVHPSGRERLSDEQLARLASGAHPDALALLYARHHAAVQRYCLGLLRHPHDAADAAQDAWARACTVLMEGQASVVRVRPWLYAIAHNACIDRARERRRVEATEPEQLDRATVPGADETLASRDELRTLLADLARLSDRQRSALLLRDVAGLSAPEAAEALGTTPDRVTWLAADARAALCEVRDGRAQACESVRRQLQLHGVRNRGVRAHVESCAACRGFERRRRGRLLHSRAIWPFPLLGLGRVRAVAERFLAFLGPGGDAPAAALKPLAAGAAAIALAAAAPAAEMAIQRPGHERQGPVTVAAPRAPRPLAVVVPSVPARDAPRPRRVRMPVPRTALVAAVAAPAPAHMRNPRAPVLSGRPAAARPLPAATPQAPAAAAVAPALAVAGTAVDGVQRLVRNTAAAAASVVQDVAPQLHVQR
jgi:RNA polymerase sigma factor (sigma-70 family)